MHILIFVLFNNFYQYDEGEGIPAMKRSYYIYNSGSLRRKDNTLTFTDENDDKRDLPIEQINDIYVMSEMTFNTSLVNLLW